MDISPSDYILPFSGILMSQFSNSLVTIHKEAKCESRTKENKKRLTFQRTFLVFIAFFPTFFEHCGIWVPPNSMFFVNKLFVEYYTCTIAAANICSYHKWFSSAIKFSRFFFKTIFVGKGEPYLTLY